MTRLLTPSFNHLTSPDSPDFWHAFCEPADTLLTVHSSNGKKHVGFVVTIDTDTEI